MVRIRAVVLDPNERSNKVSRMDELFEANVGQLQALEGISVVQSNIADGTVDILVPEDADVEQVHTELRSALAKCVPPGCIKGEERSYLRRHSRRREVDPALVPVEKQTQER